MVLLPLVLTTFSLSVPFVSQHKDTCGAASLAMVLRYWNEDVSQDDVARVLVRPELHGIAGSRLAEFARGRGLEAVTYRGDMAHLRDFVGKGRPLIVAWHLGGSRYHDVVVVGFDDERGAVLVNDPAAGPSRAVKAAKFEQRWAGAGYWTLLVTRKGPEVEDQSLDFRPIGSGPGHARSRGAVLLGLVYRPGGGAEGEGRTEQNHDDAPGSAGHGVGL